MAFSDVMLLDPVRRANEVWIALRTDDPEGAGSGTESDPFNGATSWGANQTASSITKGGADEREATVTLSNHGYQDGDKVEIGGATGLDGTRYNGRFLIYGSTTNTFKYRMKHPKPGGDASGTFTARKVLNYRFDQVMQAIPAGTLVHLGPGVFDTRGFASGVSAGFQPKSGWNLVGSGMGVTTLRLWHASTVDKHYTAVGTEWNVFLDGFEASDFSVDANLPDQPIPTGYDFAPVACAAIGVNGRRIRLRRIRAIRFGTQTKAHECFAITGSFAHPDLEETKDCLIEDCVVDQPSPNNVRETTCVLMGSGERPSDGVMAYHRDCAVRNNTVDCEYVDRPIPIAKISFNGSVATVTTKVPHGRVNGEEAVISGAVVDGDDTTSMNGSYVISYVSSTQFTYTPASPVPPTKDPVGDMWVGMASSHYVAIKSLVLNTSTMVVTLETYRPHYRVMGNNVTVANVSVTLVGTNNAFNDSFAITHVDSPFVLKYKMTVNPGTPDYSIAFIGNDFHGISADGGIGAIVESNRVNNCRIAILYHDFYSTKSILVRGNHSRAVVAGVFQNMGGRSTTDGINRKVGVSITAGGVGNLTATFTTASDKPHGFEVGQAVQILSATPSDYNGIFSVKSVPTPTSFTYQMLTAPSGPASGTFTYAAIWQVGQIIIESNVIELIRAIYGNIYAPPVGISLYRAAPVGTQFLYRQAIIRGNTIRHLDNASDSSLLPVGIDLLSCENALVETNVVRLDVNTPIRHEACGTVKYFNNQKPSGMIIEGYDNALGHFVNDLASDVELALLLTL